MAYCKKDDIDIKDKTGEGAVGNTYDVVIKSKNETVAMKVLKPTFSSTAKEAFLSQINLLKNISHPNVVRYLGVVEDMGDGKIRLVIEHMKKGSMVKLVRGNEINEQEKVSFLLQAARGLQYLHSQKIIHKDMAARNILVTKMADGSTVAKVTDYDLQGDLKLPLEWMAPERIKSNRCTTAGDIWGFGIAIWEVFSNGLDPYLEVPAAQEGDESLVKYVCEGGRLNRPNNCREEIWQLMLKTWNGDESKRISAEQLLNELDKLSQLVKSK